MNGKGRKTVFGRLGAWALAVVAVAYMLGGFFVVPRVARGLAEEELGRALSRPVTIESVSFNPLTLRAEIDGVTVMEPDGSQVFASFDALSVDVAWTSIPRLSLVVEEVRLSGPYLRLVLAGTESNFADLASSDEATQETEAVAEDIANPLAAGLPVPVVVEGVELDGGRVVIEDTLRGKTHTIEKLTASVPLLSSLPKHREHFVRPHLSAVVNGKPFIIDGGTRPFEERLNSRFVFTLRDADLPFYWAYLPVKTDLSLASGLLDCSIALDFELEGGHAPRVAVSGDATLREVSLVASGGAEVLGVDEVAVRLEKLDLGDRMLRIGPCRIVGPRVGIVRKADGRIDAAGWFASSASAPADTPTVAKGAGDSGSDAAFRAVLERLDITGGRVAFTDAAAGGFRKTVGNISATLEKLDTAPEHEGTFALSFGSEGGERVALSGSVDIAARTHRGKLDVQGVNAADYAAYHRELLPVRLVSGVLGLSLAWNGGEAPESVVVDGLAVDVRELGLERPDGRKAVGVHGIALSGGHVDVGARSVDLARLDVHGLDVHVERTREGIDLLRLAAPPAPTEHRGGDVAAPARGAVKPKAEEPRWTVRLGALTLDDASFALDDNALAVPAALRLAGLDVELEGLSSDLAAPISLRLSGTALGSGAIALDAQGALDPLALSGSVRLDALPLSAMRGYLREGTDVDLADGRVNLGGTWRVSKGDPVGVAFNGSLVVDGVSLRDAKSGASVATLGRFAVRKAAVVSEPLSVNVKTVEVVDPKLRLVVERDGRLNLARLMRRAAPDGQNATASEAPATEAQTSAEQPQAAETAQVAQADTAQSRPDIRIGEFVMSGGDVRFLDETTSPFFKTSVEAAQCRISGFSLDEGARADVAMNATIGGHAPLRVEGNIVPFGRTLDTNLDVALSNAELPPLSPYTVRHIAYPLATGKMLADVKLHLQGRELAVDNNFLLKNLALGQRVNNPDAPNLPIGLAIALLSDSQGNIQLDIPVRGNLDDPKFRVGKVVMKAIVNLLVKIVASPFSLIGSVFGGGEDVNLLVFDPGVSAPTDETLAKLKAVAEALAKRPRLRLEIAGFADAEADGPALGERFLQRSVRMRKMMELERRGEAPASVRDVTVDPAEYPQLLTRAYEAAPFDKPTNIIGMVKEQPVEVMEDLMRRSVAEDPEALRALAARRAKAVMDWLIAQGVDPARVFLREAAAGETPPASDHGRRLVVLGLR
ncbi:uncharacterized protein involved in outer membrane biogenesis [Desulfobaculum xiamenense]|uniref:Uncharacterized protein involved in outer membrane biogenesis n=1 Tax=Desulfobaculum xiamenense TaxID=995050 RepID=A0A846QJA6_9BACT|nr:DUF748 domain-containing protein [Desulfobaculum xiamenense]NJB67150.1 uncharacterized protein involved in outer membrane biogenesis [Desulfobaculum xiamenense]